LIRPIYKNLPVLNLWRVKCYGKGYSTDVVGRTPFDKTELYVWLIGRTLGQVCKGLKRGLEKGEIRGAIYRAGGLGVAVRDAKLRWVNTKPGSARLA
jgi:hypothetical protein